MLQLCLTLLLIRASKCVDKEKLMAEIATLRYTSYLPEKHALNEIQHVAHFGDAEHRGPAWYDFGSEDSSSNSDMDSKVTDSSSSSISSETPMSESSTHEASSRESSDETLARRVYRTCTPCPHDMLKKHSNIGIKWICGGYQRARRSFKSECMMRYRNCEDGTMFTKISEHRCRNDSYHGRHWFYEYKV